MAGWGWLCLHAHASAAQGPEELFETVSQCLLSGMDRDALSGWGAVVYVMCARMRSPLLSTSMPAVMPCLHAHSQVLLLLWLTSLLCACRTKDKVVARTLKGRMD